MRLSISLAAAVSLAACLESGPPATTFAPTGAKGVVNEYGEQVYLDQECGGLQSPDYAEYFQNALFRDGDTQDGRLWLVDGTHLWSAPIPETPELTVTPRLELPFVGHGNAVASAPDYLAVALIERGVTVFPGYDFAHPVNLAHDRALDVDQDGDRLAVAAGYEGVLVYDMRNPKAPVLRNSINPYGYAAGVRWGEGGILYFAACSRAGYVTFEGETAHPQYSAVLSHANAKDAHGSGERMAVADNGGGVWFYDMKTMQRAALYDLPDDPNFYTNAAVVDGEYVYVAAGNRELLALWIFGDYQPQARQHRDPIGIDVNEGVVYGFGNFRDVGRRTVVRAPIMGSSPKSVQRFEDGYPSWVEPEYHSLWSVTDSEQVLTRLEGREYRVYRAPLTGGEWTLDPAYHLLYYTGRYAISVTADRKLRVTQPDQPGTVFSGYFLDDVSLYGTYLVDLGMTDRGPAIEIRVNAVESSVWYLDEGDYASWGTDYLPQCTLENTQDEGGYSHTVNAGSYSTGGTQGTLIEWCSRTVDPYVAGNRPETDLGGRLLMCDDSYCPPIAVRESGVIGALDLGEGRVALLADDRTSYTTQVIVAAISDDGYVVSDAADGDVNIGAYDQVLREEKRFLRLGRPEGWRQLGGALVRIWFADGAALTLDLHDFTVADEIGPMEGAAL